MLYKRLSSLLLIPTLVVLGLGAGLFREIILSYYFGASREVEIFKTAFGLPSIFSDSLAVSFVSILLPVLIAQDSRQNINVGRTSTLFVGIAVAVAGAAVGILSMRAQADILAPGFTIAERDLVVQLGRWCWLMYFFVIVSLPLRAWMSLDGRIWPGAASQLIRSGTFVGVLLFFVLLRGKISIQDTAVAALASGACVLIVHILALPRSAGKTSDFWVRKNVNFNLVRSLMVSVALIFITQIVLSGGRVLDRIVASEMAVGTLAGVEYSYSVLMALGAVIGTSTNLLLSPRLGKMVQASGKAEQNYWITIIVISCFATICGVACSLLAHPIIQTIFENGAFSTDDTVKTAAIFRWHALSLGPLVLALILIQYLILTGSTKIIVPVAAVKLMSKAAALWGLVHMGFGVQGLAISLAVAECCSVLACLLFILFKMNGRARIT